MEKLYHSKKFPAAVPAKTTSNSFLGTLYDAVDGVYDCDAVDKLVNE